jgi:hypothetical protein
MSSGLLCTPFPSAHHTTPYLIEHMRRVLSGLHQSGDAVVRLSAHIHFQQRAGG